MFQGSSVSLSGLRSVTRDQDVPGKAVYLWSGLRSVTRDQDVPAGAVCLCQVLDLLREIKMFQGEQCVCQVFALL